MLGVEGANRVEGLVAGGGLHEVAIMPHRAAVRLSAAAPAAITWVGDAARRIGDGSTCSHRGCASLESRVRCG